MHELDDTLQRNMQRDAPCGANGPEAGRDRLGRFTAGNTAAVTHGARSSAFWKAVQGAQAAARAAILSDLGHDLDDAPHALIRAVDGLVQAVLIRDAAFTRIAELGGPTTLRGRHRAAFRVWAEAADRAERHMRLVGIRRVPRQITDPLADFERRAREAALEDGEEDDE
jgi:hypothetical protein